MELEVLERKKKAQSRLMMGRNPHHQSALSHGGIRLFGLLWGDVGRMAGRRLLDGLAVVEVENLGAEEVVVLGVELVALGAEQVLLGLVVLYGVGLAALVLLRHQSEGFGAGLEGCRAAGVLGLGGRGVVPGLLHLFVKGFFGAFELQGVVLLLQAGGAHLVARGEAVEEGHAQAEAYVLVEVVAHLLAEGAVDGGVVAGAEASVKAELGVVGALGDADGVAAGVEAMLGGLYAGLGGQGGLRHFGRRGERLEGECYGGALQLEAFGRVELDELAQVEQAELVAVVGFHLAHLVLRQARAGIGHFLCRGFAQALQGLDAGQLLSAQVGLSLSHLVGLELVEGLQVGRGDLHGDVVFGLLQVGQGGLEVELGVGQLVGQLHAGKEGHGGAYGEVGAVAGGVDIDGGVVARGLVLDGGLRASPVPVLSGRGVEVGQPCPASGVDLHGTLLCGVGGLLDLDVVVDGVVDASAQAPGGVGRLLSPGCGLLSVG